MSSKLQYSIDAGIAEIVMTYPQRHNAFDAESSAELVALLDKARSEGARVVLLGAEHGVKVWSAGHDISELPPGGVEPDEWVNSMAEMANAVAAFPLPLIAVVEGGVWGGACELTVCVDLIVAAENSTFAITPAKLGVAYSSEGIARFLGALPSHIVKQMFLTAEPIDAKRAYELGLVNYLAADGPTAWQQAREVAAKIAQRAPLTLQAVKTDAHAIITPTPAQIAAGASTRRAAWTSDDYKEGIAAFKSRRPPTFQGK